MVASLEKELSAYLETLIPVLGSLHTVHSLLDALYCRWVFQWEPMCEQEYSSMLMKMYEVLAASGTFFAILLMLAS